MLFIFILPVLYVAQAHVARSKRLGLISLFDLPQDKVAWTTIINKAKTNSDIWHVYFS